MTSLASKWQSQDYSKKRIANYYPTSFVDGEGVRCSVYVSGCLFACPGCFNQKVQDFSYGTLFDEAFQNQVLEDLACSYIQGLSLLGGEPFLNTEVCLSLVQAVRQCFGDEKDIWCWTGFTWEELLMGSLDKQELLSYLDVLVDGRFMINQKADLAFRGSQNQRIICVPKSLERQEIILWKKRSNDDIKRDPII